MTGPADNCGRCLTETAAVTVAPWRTDYRGGEVRAWYRCPGCGHEWRTSWDARALEAQVQDVVA